MAESGGCGSKQRVWEEPAAAFPQGNTGVRSLQAWDQHAWGERWEGLRGERLVESCVERNVSTGVREGVLPRSGL